MILADSGALVALANSHDNFHKACLDAFVEASPPRLVPTPTVTEVCYLLRREAGVAAEASFLRAFSETSFLTLVDVTKEDLARAAELIEQYGDRPLDSADACLIAIAERLRVTDVVTIDADFRIVRPKHTDHFTVIPDGL